MSYFNLHGHTEFSNIRMLDSTNKLKDYIFKAQSLGLNGVAITDHESVSGYIKAIQIQKKLQEEGSNFKIILGNEIYLVDSLEEVRDNYRSGITRFPHFILLAKDEIGCRQIREISSSAWKNSFYTGKMERVPTVKSELAEIIGDNKGHIIASTGCIGGELAHWILQNDPQSCLEFIDWCQDVFGEENFYLEMQPNDAPEQVKVNQTIIKISDQLNIPYIITTDAHYLSKDQAKIHEAYLNSREDGSRETLDFYRSCYLMTREEIHEWMDKQIGSECVNIALDNTNIIGNSIQEFDLFCPTIVPDSVVPKFELRYLFKDYYDDFEYIKKYAYSDNKYDRYLLKLIEDGFLIKNKDISLDSDEVQKVLLPRIEAELSEMWLVTEKLGTSISSYYLTTLDLVNTMWEEGDSFVGVARGSVTGMYTMYLIGITQINPLPYNLKHWRHISHSKVELSDVDLDSQANRRERIIEAIKDKRGRDKVLNCCTFKTEGAKSAILSSARGLGIDNDEAQYIASLIPVTRGFTWSIGDCLNGNAEEDRKPVTEFVNECNNYPLLLETAQTIEGIICGRSIHASAVYLFNDDFNTHNAMMKAPNGVWVTQWNMSDSDYASGLKMDLLTVEALDKLHCCMDLLLKAGHIEWQGSLRSTYNKYLHPDVLDYDSPEMWDMVGRGEITDLFQFVTDIGKSAINKIKPRSLVELATASSVMRLMKPEGEQPMDTYIRYKNDINEWYKCMREEYHLTEDEIHIMEKYLLEFHGVGATQEDVMLISMDEGVSGFDVKNSNLLRKGISKKNKNLQHKMKELLFKSGRELGTSENLLNYVWDEVIGKQLGYSFSLNHTTPYACISLQEMNLAYHYPIVYWNTACLTINGGADEQVDDNKSTDYGRIGVAIANMKENNINIQFPLINTAEYSFIPDEMNNRIIFGFKAINGIGDDVAELLIKYRPYNNMTDFKERMLDTGLIKPTQMVKLIKAGCFTNLHSPDRRITLKWYINECLYEPVKKLGMQQFNRIEELELIPHQNNFLLAQKCIHFKQYVLSDEFLVREYIDPNKKMVKKGYHDRYFVLDENSQPFFKEHFTEDSIIEVQGEYYVISEKIFSKEVDKMIEPLKSYLSGAQGVWEYNEAMKKVLFDKYGGGTTAKWSMEALSCYDDKHELDQLNEEQYGIVNFFELPKDPEPYEFYTRFINGEAKRIPKYKISRIAGTIINTDNNHHTVSLLTKNGLVNVKLNKGHYSFYNKQISEVDKTTGKKTIVEKSWLKRGNKIMVCGIRREDQFIPMIYKDTIYNHTINLILNDVDNEGMVEIQTERIKV